MKDIFYKLKTIDGKNKIVLKNTIGAFAIKGVALVISFLTTPAFIKYFNNNIILGVWYTLFSVLIWFLNFDLGIGNGIRNNLVKAFSTNDRGEAKKLISSGLFSIITVSLLLIVVGVIAIFSIDLNWLFNVDNGTISKNTLVLSVCFVFGSIMVRFCLTTISSIFYALQKSAINNFLALCVSVLQLLYVVIFRFQNAEQALLYLSIAYLIISNLPVVIAAIILFCTTLKDCRPSFKSVDEKTTKEILNIGGIFFFCQIAYMLIANTNEFLITKLFAPQYTTEYSFYYKLTSLIFIAVTLAMTPIWSVVTKAMVEKDFRWLCKLLRIIKLVGLAAIVFEFALIPIMQPIMNIWLGEDVVTINYYIAVAFACFGGAFLYSSMLSTIVCGMARMKLQLVFYTVGVVFKFVFTILAAKVFGLNWDIVVWSNAIILIPYCIAQQIDLDIYLRKQIKQYDKTREVQKDVTVQE